MHYFLPINPFFFYSLAYACHCAIVLDTMKTSLIPIFLACAALCSATQPEISPTPAGIKEKLTAAYASASGITLSFELSYPSSMTLIQAKDYELMANEGKPSKKDGKRLSFVNRDGKLHIQYDIALEKGISEEPIVFDTTMQLTAAKKNEQSTYEISPSEKSSIVHQERIYTLEPKKDNVLSIDCDTLGWDELMQWIFLPEAPDTFAQSSSKTSYHFKDALPSQVQIKQWTDISTYHYRLLYQITPGYFSFVAVPLEGHESHNIEMKFDDHAFLSEPHEKDAIFTIAPPNGYQLSIDANKKTVQAYTVGKTGQLQSMSAKLRVDSPSITDNKPSYTMRVEFPSYPEGKEVMVDDHINLSIWKIGDEANKIETRTPLRFRFKPLTVDKVKAVKASEVKTPAETAPVYISDELEPAP